MSFDKWYLALKLEVTERVNSLLRLIFTVLNSGSIIERPLPVNVWFNVTYKAAA